MVLLLAVVHTKSERTRNVHGAHSAASPKTASSIRLAVLPSNSRVSRHSSSHGTESLEAFCERFRSAYEPTDVSEQGLASTYSFNAEA